MNLNLTNERIRELIPNVIHEVKGEISLCDKLTPWINSAENWLVGYILGSDFDVPESLTTLVEKIVVNMAFAEAIPSLDVALSPSGFAVINTDGRAPASKERIERLITSINSFVDANIEVLVDKLLHTPEWVDSSMGLWWRGTFIPSISEAFRFRAQSRLFDTYRSMRSLALCFEREVAALYMGNELMMNLRHQQFTAPENEEIITMIREAELRYISFHLRDQKAKCPDEHEVWHLIRPVIERLKYFPDLHRQWQLEIGDRFKPEPFNNDIKGGFYF